MSQVANPKHEFGGLELSSPQGIYPDLREIDLSPDIARAFGLPLLQHHIPAQSKTMSFQGKLFITGRQDPIAILEDVTVTVTRMTDPSTERPFLMISLDYFATSHGFRTGDGKLIIVGPGHTSHEPYKAPHWLYFRNSAGGIMYTAWLGMHSFELQCGWTRQHQLFGLTEHVAVDWFDLWQGVTHEVKGSFFSC